MGETCPIMRPGTARRFMLLGLLSLLALCAQLVLAGRRASELYDMYGLLVQLGVLPPPHGAASDEASPGA